MTGTISFTVVKDRSRVFGIDKDNIRGWHEYGFDQPDAHVSCGPVSFREFHSMVMKNIKTILE